MLLGVPKIIPPELLKILSEMGHGDEITLGDANFPGHTCGQTVVRMDGHGVPEILEAILQLIPLDAQTAQPAMVMQVTPGDPTETPIWDTYKEIIARHDASRRGLRGGGRALRLLRPRQGRKAAASS